MITLLIIIYLAFISLGLPDSILGAAWPVMQSKLSLPVSFAGVISMLVCCGTVVSSFYSVRLIQRFGTGLITAVSVFMTSAALLLFSYSHTGIIFCMLALPLGIGAGCVDAALNNFVALHYQASHMNWLHCFWGIGAGLGPLIMSFWLKGGDGLPKNNWQMGYFSIGVCQMLLVIVLFCSVPLFRKSGKSADPDKEERKAEIVPVKDILKIKNAKPVLAALFCYCGLELTAGLWGSTYAVGRYQVEAGIAASWTSLYYMGITAGRFAAGFMAMRFQYKHLIRLGQGLILMGVMILLLPLPAAKIPLGQSLIGLGCAPIYPAMLHQTPVIFGLRLSQAMMGISMACAYVGSALLPPLFGVIADLGGLSLFGGYLLVIVLVMFVGTEYVNRFLKSATPEHTSSFYR